jgi:hypothetical protein
MTLYEIGLSKAQPLNTAHSRDFYRFEILYTCLESVGKLFETFLAIPAASYWSFSLIHFSQLAFALNLLQRLSIFEDPTWDLQYVAEKVNFLHIIDRSSSQMEEAMRYGLTRLSNASECMNIFA